MSTLPIISDDERARVHTSAERSTQEIRRLKRGIPMLTFIAGVWGGLCTEFLGSILTADPSSSPTAAAQAHAYAGALITGILTLIFLGIAYVAHKRVDDELQLSPADALLRLEAAKTTHEHLEEELGQAADELTSAEGKLFRQNRFVMEWCGVNELFQTQVIGFVRRVTEKIEKPDPSLRASADDYLQGMEADFTSILQTLIAHLERHQHELFEHKPRYSFFDLFEFEPDQRLRLVARATSGQPKEHHRVWKANEGQLGRAIVRNEAILENIPAEKIRAEREPQFQSTDPEYFQSVIMAPIPGIGRKPYDSYGLLVVTSSTIAGLTNVHLSFVESLAFRLTSMFAVRERAYSRLRNVKPSSNR